MTKGGVRGGGEVKSIPRIEFVSSYEGKVFSNIFISIYVNSNGFRANRYE
jgi:hypothetical protein